MSLTAPGNPAPGNRPSGQPIHAVRFLLPGAAVENLLPEAGAAGFEAMLDVEMMIYTAGGRERTQAEYRALLARAGLTLARSAPMSGALHVLEARSA